MTARNEKSSQYEGSTETIISALRILARDIQSDDGVANACIDEAATRLEEYYELFKQLPAKTLRDEFAMAALNAGIITEASWRDQEYVPDPGLSMIGNQTALAYEYADAMLEARK